MTKVLVTGATGFIGRALCGKLLAESFQVSAAVWRGEPPVTMPDTITAIPIDSIGPDTNWDQALVGIGTVIHLAARVHVMDETEEEPLAAYRRVNVAGTERLARMAAAAGVKRLVYLSSVKVLGEESAVSYTEQAKPAPLDPYGVSKLEAEEVLKKVAGETGLEVVVIRPPLVYGPGVKANFLKLMRLVAKGLPLPLASVNNARSLVYLENLIDAIVLCAAHPKAAGQAYLVSDGEGVATPELIRRIAVAMGRPARLFSFPPGLIRLAGKLTGRTGAMDRLLGSLAVDDGKIRKELGWKPPYTMAEGVKATTEWFAGLED
jgi:nucleoside-diphosphate-sugar epimerase